MTDRSTFDPFEKRIADGLERYVVPATDPKPAAEIARDAMRPRGLVVRARNASRRRRFLLLGLAAALLIPAAYVGFGGIRPPSRTELVVRPSRTDGVLPAPTEEAVGPSPTGDVRSITDDSVSIFVRRDGSEPGASIYAARPDGSEALLRKVPDSILAGQGKVSEYGTVSESGWLALGVDHYGGPWPMILVDLGDMDAQPWVITQADLGGVGPRWGPTGLVAAVTDNNFNILVIVDPETHTTHTVFMKGRGLVGGGPSIVWTASGSGIVGSNGNGMFDTVPIDGGDPQPGVGEVFDPRGSYGSGLAELRVCLPDMQCPGGGGGRVERVEPGASVQTIWKQVGDDRALAASFGGLVGEYWLTLDHDKGRQVALVHEHDGRQDAVATVNRAAGWQYVGAPVESPDRSTALVWIDLGGKPAALLVPLNGVPASFHRGSFAGFVNSAASPLLAIGSYEAPAETMPATGEAYRLPSLDDLIAAELTLNPGRHVLGKASHDGVDGDLAFRTSEVQRDQPGTGELYLDCIGPSSVTVTSGSNSVTNPCLRAGAGGFMVGEAGRILVTARGDTFWRVVIYSP